MVYRALADCVVLLHAAFVAFVVLGGFVAWRWRGVVWAHVPAALWGAAIEYGGWGCPLTPLENALRARAGLEGYRGGVIGHHEVPPLFPAGASPAAPAGRGPGGGGGEPRPDGARRRPGGAPGARGAPP